jgi:hypothetical protein
MARARSLRATLIGFLAALGVASAATAQPAVGDLDGDGTVSPADEALLESYFREISSDPNAQYEPAADLNSDGVVDILDLGIFGAGFGQTGDVDTTPPDLLITLNDIPDDMNDLLVVPPDQFQITLHLDSQGGSAIDLSSLSVTSNRDIGALPAGTELAGFFSLTPTRAVWNVPTGSDLQRTSHYLTVSIDDLASNTSGDVYGYAVRDFPFGQPMETLQSVFLDFDGNQGPGSFTEDLREYGLSSDATPEAQALEPQMRASLIAEILERVRPYYGLDPDGTPGPDAVDLIVTDSDPGFPRARLCVGGSSGPGGSLLGAAFMDVHNASEDSDECSGIAGVFPQAVDNLWGSDPDYQAAIHPLDPDEGGVPVGEHPEDATVLAPGFDVSSATGPQLSRLLAILDGVDAFAQVIASAVAHEVGHTFGLVAHGAAPGGLYGGTSGGRTDHNVNTFGGTPSENFIMNAGGSFSFGEMTGRGGPLPVFRELAWAYLHDRVVVDEDVTGLFEPPEITSASPNPAVFPDCCTPIAVTIYGANFLAPSTPTVSFPIEGSTPGELFNPVVLDAGLPTERIEGLISPFDMALEGVYDVTVLGSDGQVVTLPDALEVQFQ